MHETIIIFIVLIIVVAQFAVGFTAWKKIDAYKKIIPEAVHFETVKVFIPESQVKNIDIDHVLRNPDAFQHSEDEPEPFMSELAMEAFAAEEYDALSDIPEDTVWVSKGNEEKKIEQALLDRYLSNGWSVL
jgi:hypothetical protein